jgi:drug/metabolite transporter (DMT)-like permease
MNAFQFGQALVSVFGISTGQLLLKLAAVNLQNSRMPGISVYGLHINAYLAAGVALLGVSTLIWVSVLRSVPLSFAYPLMALCFIIVPALSYFVLSEPLSWKLAFGSGLIGVGLIVIYS